MTAGKRKPPVRKTALTAAADRPVASVAVDISLAHLDRLFDYLVPENLAGAALPGVRVRVRFAGRLTDGFVLERAASSGHPGKLAFLERVVSPEPVLGPELAGLARAVADRYGGTLADVLRLAIPPRHAAAERQPSRSVPGDVRGAAVPGDVRGAAVPGKSASAGDVLSAGDAASADGDGDPAAGYRAGCWDSYQDGASFLAALAAGRSPRACWLALPGAGGLPGAAGAAQRPGASAVPRWAGEIAEAVAATLVSGRGSVVVVPDVTDLAAVDLALTTRLGAGRHVSLSAQLGPAERYRRWLAASRGQVRVVAGTRSAAFAPVTGLGLVVIWDDGDDVHAELRAPYPNARDVLLLRAHRSGAGALLAGYARTAECAQLIATGWARPLAAGRSQVRRLVPLVQAAGEDAELARDEAARTARIPSLALRTTREALTSGPVLFQVPRRGYLAAVACRRCHARIRCAACSGPVRVDAAGQPPGCGWCGAPAPGTCGECGSTGLRAMITGARRTAEELGRAFPAAKVLTSSGDGTLGAVAADPAIVIATPGAEPRAAGGYAAAILLDGWALLGRPSLRAAEETLRRWLNAAALVRPGSDGGRVVVLAEPSLAPVQALIRWDPAWHAERELAERAELGFPPAVRMASLTGPQEVVGSLLTSVALPAGAGVLGPVPVRQGSATGCADETGPGVRFLIRVPSAAGTALAIALRAGLAERGARKEPGAIRVQLDPAELA